MVDFSNQMNRIFTNLLNLDKITKDKPFVNKMMDANGKIKYVSVDVNVLNQLLMILRNLVEETIPMNLYAITKTFNLYQKKVS